MLSCQQHLFSLPRGLHYLNCGYMSPLSKRVEQAAVEGLRRKRVPSEIAAPDFVAGLDGIRELFARLVSVPDPQRIAVFPSASYGLATAAANLPLARGQNIVITAEQFPSNVYVWRRVAAQVGASVRTVSPPRDTARRGREWNTRLLESIDPDTAIVALGHVHWTDGTRFDLDALAERARQVGAAVVVDGTQSIGALPLDVAALDPDAVICAGYKWLMGPYSVAVGYFGPRFDAGRPLEETWLARKGSQDFRRLVDYQDAYRPGAVRYDSGESSNFALVPALLVALEQVLEWGVSGIQSYCTALTDELADGAAPLGFGAEEPAWRAGHMMGLRMPRGMRPEAVLTSLSERQIVISARGDVLRISPHLYNDRGDIEALLEGLEALVGAAGRA